MFLGRALALVLLLSSAVALLATGSSTAAPPTQLYYKISVEFAGYQYHKSSVISYDETGGILDQRLALEHNAAIKWNAKTNESVLLRKLPDGRVTFISSGNATVDFKFSERGTEGMASFAHGFVMSPPCERTYRGGVLDGVRSILTTGGMSISAESSSRQTLVVNVNQPTSELTVGEATCIAQRNADEPPFSWHVDGKHFAKQQRVHLSGLPGLGLSAPVELGNNLRINFGRRAISLTRTQAIDLGHVAERDVNGRPTAVVVGRARMAIRVVFRRCPHARPC